jgi:hypothetical protein
MRPIELSEIDDDTRLMVKITSKSGEQAREKY